MALVFDLAEKHGVAVDFHLDFDLNPDHTDLPAVIALTVLPATDLFLGGRGHDRLVPRGVVPAYRLAAAGIGTSIATNNVFNPFTPFGNASLIRMANLYATVAQLSRHADIAATFAMVSSSAARLMNGALRARTRHGGRHRAARLRRPRLRRA